MARKNRRDDIDITKEELNQISEALKKEEFRKLFIEYVDEINDPKNKALFEQEVTQYEKERGIEVTFIHPKPGYVIKTSVDGSKKAFINVCSNEKISKPLASRGEQEGTVGTEWSLPYIQAPPRDDLDKNNKLCVVYDVIFHPLTLDLAKKDQRIKSFVNDTALAAVESSFEVNLDKANLKFPKMNFKGYKHACVIRKRVSSPAGPSEGEGEDILTNPFYPYSEPVADPLVVTPKYILKKEEYATPKYVIKHRKNLDFQEFTYAKDAKMNTCVAHELLIEIELPLIRSTSDVELLLNENTLSLKSDSPAKYKLEINLPYCISENESSAKFDGSSRKLIVSAIVDRRKHCLSKEDSGLESDPSRCVSSSSDEDIAKLDKANFLMNSLSNSNILQKDNSVRNDDICTKEDYLSMDSHEDMEMDIFEPFLNPDTYYSLPMHKLYKVSNSIVSDLYAKNVEPSSISYIFSENNSQFQIKFYSMGSGFVPINYMVCLKLGSLSFDAASFKYYVCDNSVGVSVSLNESSSSKMCPVYFGREPSECEEVSLENFDPNSSVFSEAVSNFLKQKNKKDTGDIILKLFNLKLYSTADDDSDDCEEEESAQQSTVDDIDAIVSNNEAVENTTSSNKTDPKIRRTYSESGCALPLIQRRSILKDTRSLSESNANDYAGFSMSMDSEDGSGLTESGLVKKHVRFSETISKKVFRANSSILGQRKKNQRKARNKKRSSERRNSEGSWISDSDVSELEVSEVSDLSEVSDISETSESDDGSTVEKSVPQTPSSKSHRRKGKKNHRKSANTAKINCLFENDA